MSTRKNKPLALIGENAKNFIRQGLVDNGFIPIVLPADSRLAPQVSSHADMLVLAIENTVFCNKVYYENNKPIFNIITEYGYTVHFSDFEVSSKYPKDVALNQAKIGKNIIGRADSCAKAVLDYVNSHGYIYRSVKQGYSKCSTLILNDTAIISADSGIIDLANRFGIKSLKIDNRVNDITLDGYNYGFIGGASAIYKNKVFFFGNLKLHSQAEKIINFCNCNGFIPISLGEKNLCDIGGAIILPYINT